jgi:hypothetical protein
MPTDKQDGQRVDDTAGNAALHDDVALASWAGIALWVSECRHQVLSHSPHLQARRGSPHHAGRRAPYHRCWLHLAQAVLRRRLKGDITKLRHDNPGGRGAVGSRWGCVEAGTACEQQWD